MIIKVSVVPNFETKRWCVMQDDLEYGVTKNSYDADFHAEILGKQLRLEGNDVTIEHNVKERVAQLEQMKGK